MSNRQAVVAGFCLGIFTAMTLAYLLPPTAPLPPPAIPKNAIAVTVCGGDASSG